MWLIYLLLTSLDDLLELFQSLMNHGVFSIGGLAAVVMAISRQHRKRQFQIRDQRWERKFDAIAEAVGAKWTGNQGTSQTDRTSLNKWWQSCLMDFYRAASKLRRVNMGTLNKAILIPLLSTVALIVKYATGYEIPNPAIDMASDIILAVINVMGILMHPTNGGNASGGTTYSAESFK